MLERLPPLQTLRAFEVAGRQLSMTLAAEELQVTHGAVNRQIKALEQHLGVPLFHRMTRKVELTEAGALLFTAVTRLFSELAREAENLRPKNDRTRLVVRSDVSFASKWLMPRLHSLLERHPEYDVRVSIADSNPDLSAGEFDVAIRYGAGRYRNAAAERIMDETVSPVCAPEYRDRMGRAFPMSACLSTTVRGEG